MSDEWFLRFTFRARRIPQFVNKQIRYPNHGGISSTGGSLTTLMLLICG